MVIKMFMWGLYDGFLYRLLLLKLIFSMKRYMCIFGGWVKMYEFCVYAF